MKYSFLLFSIVLTQQAFTQYEAWNVSCGVDKLTNELYLFNPTNVSTIQRTAQWELNGTRMQHFKNKKYFGYVLGTQVRVENYQADIRVPGQSNIPPVEFSKVSFNGSYGLMWRFPLVQNKLYFSSGLTFGFRVYRNPKTLIGDLDGFESAGCKYLFEVQNKSHLNINAQLNGSLCFQLNERIALHVAINWISTEDFLYKITVGQNLPGTATNSDMYDNLYSNPTFTTSVQALGFSFGLTFNVLQHEK